MRHLAKYMHDVTTECTEVWCEKGSTRDASEDADVVDCKPCLTAAVQFGNEAAGRLRALRPKDWNACPYAAHSDDCDCGGRGGDR